MACSSISRHELSASCTCLICHAAGVVSGPGKATHWHRIARRAAHRQSHHRKRKRMTAPLVARGKALIDPVPQEAALRVLHRVESLPPLVEIATRVAHRVRILTEYQWSHLVCMSRARPVAHRAAVRHGTLPCDHVHRSSHRPWRVHWADDVSARRAASRLVLHGRVGSLARHQSAIASCVGS